MKKIWAVTICMCFISDLGFGTFVRGIDIDFATIGNPGNPGENRYVKTSGYGSVDYVYQIGRYEVTNKQWNTFLSLAGVPTGNDGGYDGPATTSGDLQPVNRISYYEAVQFCNYLTSGDKSKGVYLFSGNNSEPGDFIGIDRTSAGATYGKIYFLPNIDEWYKAAYYRGDGRYSDYANGTNSIPISPLTVNYDGLMGQAWEVGTGPMEQNGTYDMMGNLAEWMEQEPVEVVGGQIHGVHRGGSYASAAVALRPTTMYSLESNMESNGMGFRVVSIPEPATVGLLGLGGLALLRRKK